MFVLTHKVHIFWEGHKILQNLHRRFYRYYIGQIYGADFAKICGLLRMYEFYHLEYYFSGWMTYKKQIKMISALMNYSMSCLAMNNITNTSKCNFTLWFKTGSDYIIYWLVRYFFFLGFIVSKNPTVLERFWDFLF